MVELSPGQGFGPHIKMMEREGNTPGHGKAEQPGQEENQRAGHGGGRQGLTLRLHHPIQGLGLLGGDSLADFIGQSLHPPVFPVYQVFQTQRGCRPLILLGQPSD